MIKKRFIIPQTQYCHIMTMTTFHLQKCQTANKAKSVPQIFSRIGFAQNIPLSFLVFEK